MNRAISFPTLFSCLFFLMFVPCTKAGSRSPQPGLFRSLSFSVIDNNLKKESDKIYDSLGLENFGLSAEAFEYAYRGYHYLLSKGLVKNPGIITVCDFSQSSANKRLYVIDIDKYELLINTYVAHGRNSGTEYARKFSNKPRSHQSSLGFYITKNSYYGEHGLSLRLSGMEKGINDKANARNIVIHGAAYASPDFIRRNSFLGRSYGCPAVPRHETEKLINTIKNGTCLFIYHPGKQYLTSSKIING